MPRNLSGKTHEVKVNRSAKDGQFVADKEAKDNPDTTVTEKVQKTRLVKDGLDPPDYSKVLWKEVPVEEANSNNRPNG